jgi:hypothetical protein
METDVVLGQQVAHERTPATTVQHDAAELHGAEEAEVLVPRDVETETDGAYAALAEKEAD